MLRQMARVTYVVAAVVVPVKKPTSATFQRTWL
jgi:hypothetical protein